MRSSISFASPYLLHARYRDRLRTITGDYAVIEDLLSDSPPFDVKIVRDLFSDKTCGGILATFPEIETNQ